MRTDCQYPSLQPSPLMKEPMLLAEAWLPSIKTWTRQYFAASLVPRCGHVGEEADAVFQPLERLHPFSSLSPMLTLTQLSVRRIWAAIAAQNFLPHNTMGEKNRLLPTVSYHCRVSHLEPKLVLTDMLTFPWPLMSLKLLSHPHLSFTPEYFGSFYIYGLHIFTAFSSQLISSWLLSSPRQELLLSGSWTSILPVLTALDIRSLFFKCDPISHSLEFSLAFPQSPWQISISIVFSITALWVCPKWDSWLSCLPNLFLPQSFSS